MATPFAGRYALVDPLGEGGSGIVWRAWDSREGRYVAAKVLRQVDAATLMRFMREQATRIDHHHVLVPTGWTGEDERVLLAMPLVDGGSVATLTGDFWPLPNPWVARLLHQALLALQAIHAAGVIHRDVTPANLLLDATGTAEPRLRLSDFGIAQHRDDPRLTTGPITVGTAGFRAPEAFTVDPEPNQDVFALGATLATLTDSPVFADIATAMQNPDPQARPTVPHLVANLAETGLLTASLGDEVEVFNQLPALPEGWSDSGPVARVANVVPQISEPAQVANVAPQISEPARVAGDPAVPSRWGARGWLLVGSVAALGLGVGALVTAVLL